ncbi:hypothetical protein LCGC14_1118750 [marine sediment metagenome]|uniref:Uncharacterized protein n=1 Tax=marine sediment metagenome TaxID=412755 RepID=A0A0F9M4K0_9ZZZZ
MNLKEFFKIKPISDTRHIAGLSYWILLVFGLLATLIILTINQSQLIPFELEGSCNSGKVNINFDAEFRNQAYSKLKEIDNKNISLTKFNIEYYPKSITFDGIENLNCNYKIKGAIPKKIILENWR